MFKKVKDRKALKKLTASDFLKIRKDRGEKRVLGAIRLLFPNVFKMLRN